MPTIPTKKEEEKLKFNPWPYLDTLYDYELFLDKGFPKIPRNDKKVAIIGAGVAGLYAARLLLEAGVIPDIYEASDRIGGRLYSKHFHDKEGNEVEAFAELGAMRMPKSSKIFFNLAKKFGLDSNIPFPDPGLVDTLLYYQNESFEWKAKQLVPDIFAAVGENWNLLITPLIEKISKPWKEGKLEKVREIWQNYIDHYKGVSFYQAIKQGSPVWTQDELNRFGTLGIGTGGFGPLYNISFIEILRVVLHRWEDEQMLIKDGTETFAKRLYDTEVKTPHGMKSLCKDAHLFLDTKITNIKLTDKNKPIISYSEKKQLVSKEYDALIVATTTRSMQFMGLSSCGVNEKPSLDKSTSEALRNIHLINSSKLFIRTKTKFWKNKKLNLPENIQTDELPRGIYLLDYPQTDNGVICMSYTWGDDSAKLSGLDPKNRFILLKDSIHKINPKLAHYLVPVNDEIIHIDWQIEPNYYGAFKLNFPGQDDDAAALFFHYQSVNDPKKDTGIYLAGDSVSWAGGWIEGALHTAINAATAVAKRFGASIPNNSPLSISKKMYNYD